MNEDDECTRAYDECTGAYDECTGAYDECTLVVFTSAMPLVASTSYPLLRRCLELCHLGPWGAAAEAFSSTLPRESTIHQITQTSPTTNVEAQPEDQIHPTANAKAFRHTTKRIQLKISFVQKILCKFARKILRNVLKYFATREVTLYDTIRTTQYFVSRAIS